MVLEARGDGREERTRARGLRARGGEGEAEQRRTLTSTGFGDQPLGGDMAGGEMSATGTDRPGRETFCTSESLKKMRRGALAVPVSSKHPPGLV